MLCRIESFFINVTPTAKALQIQKHYKIKLKCYNCVPIIDVHVIWLQLTISDSKDKTTLFK